MGNTCKPMAVSFQCMTKFTTNKKKSEKKILQARLQQYVKHKFPDVQVGKGSGTRYQTDNFHWIIEKAREFKKNIYFCFMDYTKVFDCVDHNKLENS